MFWIRCCSNDLVIRCSNVVMTCNVLQKILKGSQALKHHSTFECFFLLTVAHSVSLLQVLLKYLHIFLEYIE